MSSKVSKKVIKEWADGGDTDKLRPEKITVELYKVVDGQKIKICDFEKVIVQYHYL